jgi:hypothetical protein
LPAPCLFCEATAPCLAEQAKGKKQLPFVAEGTNRKAKKAKQKSIVSLFRA